MFVIVRRSGAAMCRFAVYVDKPAELGYNNTRKAADMKNFIMTVPMQAPANLHKTKYISMGGKELESEYETCYPVFTALDNTVDADEEIKLTLIVVDHDNARSNLASFLDELKDFAETRSFTYKIQKLDTPYDESTDTHLELFGKVIDSIAPRDEITADITYGSKPMPMIISMALSYAKNNISGTDIQRIIYGRYDFVHNKAFVHDVTALFYMNSVVEKLGHTKAENPRNIIRTMLEL